MLGQPGPFGGAKVAFRRLRGKLKTTDSKEHIWMMGGEERRSRWGKSQGYKVPPPTDTHMDTHLHTSTHIHAHVSIQIHTDHIQMLMHMQTDTNTHMPFPYKDQGPMTGLCL